MRLFSQTKSLPYLNFPGPLPLLDIITVTATTATLNTTTEEEKSGETQEEERKVFLYHYTRSSKTKEPQVQIRKVAVGEKIIFCIRIHNPYHFHLGLHQVSLVGPSLTSIPIPRVRIEAKTTELLQLETIAAAPSTTHPENLKFRVFNCIFTQPVPETCERETTIQILPSLPYLRISHVPPSFEAWEFFVGERMNHLFKLKNQSEIDIRSLELDVTWKMEEGEKEEYRGLVPYLEKSILPSPPPVVEWDEKVVESQLPLKPTNSILLPVRVKALPKVKSIILRCKYGAGGEEGSEKNFVRTTQVAHKLIVKDDITVTNFDIFTLNGQNSLKALKTFPPQAILVGEEYKGSEYALLMFEITNTSLSGIHVICEDKPIHNQEVDFCFNKSSGEFVTIKPKSSKRIIVCVEKMKIEVEEKFELADVRQHISTAKTLTQQDIDFQKMIVGYKKAILDRVHLYWFSVHHQHGKFDLRQIKLTPLMVEALKKKEIQVKLKMGGEGVKLDRVESLLAKVVNLGEKETKCSIEIVPLKDSHHVMEMEEMEGVTWVGRKKVLVKIGGGEEREVGFQLLFLQRGFYRFVALVKEVEGKQTFWSSPFSVTL